MLEVLRAWRHDLQWPLESIRHSLGSLRSGARVRLGDLLAVAWCQFRGRHELEQDLVGLEGADRQQLVAALETRHHLCSSCAWCAECTERRPDALEQDEPPRLIGRVLFALIVITNAALVALVAWSMRA